MEWLGSRCRRLVDVRLGSSVPFAESPTEMPVPTELPSPTSPVEEVGMFRRAGKRE